MLDRRNIHNSAMLKPKFKKQVRTCQYYFINRKHAFYKQKDGTEQCVECGRINQKGQPYGLHKPESN